MHESQSITQRVDRKGTMSRRMQSRRLTVSKANEATGLALERWTAKAQWTPRTSWPLALAHDAARLGHLPCNHECERKSQFRNSLIEDVGSCTVRQRDDVSLAYLPSLIALKKTYCFQFGPHVS